MKYLAFILIFLQSCGKETPPIVRVDNCPLCSSSIEINNAEWEAKPYYALFTTNNANDSTFTIWNKWNYFHYMTPTKMDYNLRYSIQIRWISNWFPFIETIFLRFWSIELKMYHNKFLSIKRTTHYMTHTTTGFKSFMIIAMEKSVLNTSHKNLVGRTTRRIKSRYDRYA